MKKKYISPYLQACHIGGKDDLLQTIIVGSNGDTADEDDLGWVKEDRGSAARGGSGGRGVWDDDWSKQ